MDLQKEIIRLTLALAKGEAGDAEKKELEGLHAARIAELDRQYEKKQNDAALTAKQLIEILSELPPETPIFGEVDSDKNPVTKDSVYLKNGKFWIFAEWV